MPDLQSRLGFYTKLLENVYYDTVVSVLRSQNVGLTASQNRDILRDITELRKRCECEGMPFITVILPKLGKSIDSSLATGTSLVVSDFKKKKGTELPCFMHEMFRLVFTSDGVPLARRDSESSIVLEDQKTEDDCSDATIEACEGLSVPLRWERSANALRALRQVCFLLYKLELPYTREQEEKVITDFVSVDKDLADHPLSSWVSRDYNDALLRTARHLVCRVVGNVSPHSGVARHGPGAVATGEKAHQKHKFSRLYTDLCEEFQWDEWFALNATAVCDSYKEWQTSLTVHKAGTAKVVLVPKDSRGPRLISCEPLEYQWIQQALCGVLVDTIQSHPLTRGFVNFTNQEVNRGLALTSSSNGQMVTLDMKEASDRVSLELVQALFPAHWYRALYASRTPATKLPDGTVHQMNKFAPMGSAVCFPVEALIFWALSRAAIINKRGLRRDTSDQVYVYGDDIITGSANHAIVYNALSQFNLKLNADKCCTHGPFAESCGMDAYLGHPVTPLRFRKMWCLSRKSGYLDSYVAFSNAAWKRGMFRTSLFLSENLREIWGDTIPTVKSECGIIAYVRPELENIRSISPKRRRYNRRTQMIEIKGFCKRPSSVMTTVEGWHLFLRIAVKRDKDNNAEEQRDYSYVPRASQLRAGEFVLVGHDRLQTTWTAAPQ